MIRVRRSCIRPLAAQGDKHAPGMIGCTLLITGAEQPKPYPGIAVLTPDTDFEECAQASDQAARFATQTHGFSVFEVWRKIRDGMTAWQASNRRSEKAAGFGLALVERAIIDAQCRLWKTDLRDAVQANRFRINLGEVCKPLAGREPSELLEANDQSGMRPRLAIAPGDDLSPESPLAQTLAVGKIRDLSIGLTGNIDADFARIFDVGQCLGKSLGSRFNLSLEGNGTYAAPGDLRRLMEKLRNDPATRSLAQEITFIEQPFPVDSSFSPAAVAVFAEWPERPAILVDEANTTPTAAARALEWGYSGAVFRANRGLIPGLVYACLLGARREREPVGKWMLAGGPVSLQSAFGAQSEIAAANALGLHTVTVAADDLHSPSLRPIPADWLDELRPEHREILLQETPDDSFAKASNPFANQ